MCVCARACVCDHQKTTIKEGKLEEGEKTSNLEERRKIRLLQERKMGGTEDEEE